jgi:hypothetical protein
MIDIPLIYGKIIGKKHSFDPLFFQLFFALEAVRSQGAAERSNRGE